MSAATVSTPVRIGWVDCHSLMRIGVNGHRALAVPTLGRRATRVEIMASAEVLCPEAERVALALWLEEQGRNLAPVVTVAQQVAEIEGRPVAEVEAQFAEAEWEIVDA